MGAENARQETTGEGISSWLHRSLPWIWLAMSVLWAVVIFVTDQLAWPLALWIATTVGPLTYLRNSKRPTEDRSQKTERNQK